MKEITIRKNEAGQRLDKFLLKYLNLAPSSLIYKYLRKKEIRLNGARAQGNAHLQEGDKVQLHLTDAMLASLRGEKAVQTGYSHIHVIYEDEDVLILDKPAGILTQKAAPSDISLNEEMLSYLMEKGEVTQESLSLFKPSVCNRLDRNTAGLVMAGKTLSASQTLNEMIRSRSVKKEYQCIVTGIVEEAQQVESWLRKEKETNQVRIFREETPGASKVITFFSPVCSGNGHTRLRVELVTGKTHQIRAQMAALGHPIVGDAKYGTPQSSIVNGKRVRSQALFAWRLVFPASCGALPQLSGLTVEAPMPASFSRIAQALDLMTEL